MADPTKIPSRQLDIGAASYFRVSAESPAGNQVRVSPGFVYAGGYSVADQVTGVPAAGQLTAAFAPVAAASQRYDLVYLDQAGVAQLLQGNQVAFGSPVHDGAPGFNLGPDLPGEGIPVAYVLVTETGAVVVEDADISQLGGQFHVGRELEGYVVDKGLFGGAPAGISDDVSALFPTDVPGGSTTQRGAVTAPPLNYVTLVDQVGDEVLHSSGARMFGRLTEAATVWTLAYLYIDGAGAEQTMDPSSDTSGVAPTDIRLVGTPVVFSRNDPARPLFQSGVARLSDQVVGDIPTATTTVQGKALAGPTGPVVPLIGTVNTIRSAGAPVSGGPFHQLDFSGGVTPGASGEAVINLAAGAPGPTGPAGPTGPTGPAGPPGPGFTSQGPSQALTIQSQPSRTGSNLFNFGFTVRFYMVTCNTIQSTANVYAAWVTSITVAGVGVTVNWQTVTPGPGNFVIVCSAAG